MANLVSVVLVLAMVVLMLLSLAEAVQRMMLFILMIGKKIVLTYR
jgi:hypothetical protein